MTFGDTDVVGFCAVADLTAKLPMAAAAAPVKNVRLSISIPPSDESVVHHAEPEQTPSLSPRGLSSHDQLSWHAVHDEHRAYKAQTGCSTNKDQETTLDAAAVGSSAARNSTHRWSRHPVEVWSTPPELGRCLKAGIPPRGSCGALTLGRIFGLSSIGQCEGPTWVGDVQRSPQSRELHSYPVNASYSAAVSPPRPSTPE